MANRRRVNAWVAGGVVLACVTLGFVLWFPWRPPDCPSALRECGQPVSPLFVGFLGLLMSAVLIIVGIMRSPR
jgi:hypothetical protein